MNVSTAPLPVRLLMSIVWPGVLAPVRTSVMPESTTTFGSTTLVPWPLTVIVDPLTEQLVPSTSPRLEHAVAPPPAASVAAVRLAVVVGGVTGNTGDGKYTVPGSLTCWPWTVPVNPTTAPAVQAPEPSRGV